MSRIERISVLPDWDWSVHCGKEIQLTGADLALQTDFVWQIGNSAVVGFIYHSYCCPPFMWMVLKGKVPMREVLDYRRLKDQIPIGTLTGVHEDFIEGLRFAALFGFRPTGEIRRVEGHNYLMYRRG